LPKGKIQHALAALEQEYRTTPKPGSESYSASVDLQKKVLRKIGDWGNKEMAPTLNFFCTASDQSVRDAAKKVKLLSTANRIL